MTQTIPTEDASMTRGLLLRKEPTQIILGLIDTDYQLHLQVDSMMEGALNQPINGHIFARAKRVDVVRAGGRFIEPVYGRPRRLQGRVTAVHSQANAITVHCGCSFFCELTAGQQASDFSVGLLVSFDVERGAVFKQVKLDLPASE